MIDLGRDEVEWGYRVDLPVLGVPMTFLSDSSAVVQLVEQTYGAWAAIADRTDLVAGEGAVVRIRVDRSSPTVTFDGLVEYRLTGPTGLEIASTGGRAISDSRRREATCRVACNLLDRPADFAERFLEAMTLFLVGALDREPLHAAAVIRDGTALLLEGRSGTGKSTLAYAASRRGFALFSDEAVYVQTDPFRVWSRRSRIHLRPEARELFPELEAVPVVDLPDGKRRIVVSIEGGAPRYADRAAICVLERGASATARRITADEAATILECHLEPGFDRYADTVRHRAALVAEGGAWVLTLGPDPFEGVALLEAVAKEVRGAKAGIPTSTGPSILGGAHSLPPAQGQV